MALNLFEFHKLKVHTFTIVMAWTLASKGIPEDVCKIIKYYALEPKHDPGFGDTIRRRRREILMDSLMHTCWHLQGELHIMDLEIVEFHPNNDNLFVVLSNISYCNREIRWICDIISYYKLLFDPPFTQETAISCQEGNTLCIFVGRGDPPPVINDFRVLNLIAEVLLHRSSEEVILNLQNIIQSQGLLVNFI